MITLTRTQTIARLAAAGWEGPTSYVLAHQEGKANLEDLLRAVEAAFVDGRNGNDAGLAYLASHGAGKQGGARKAAPIAWESTVAAWHLFCLMAG